MAVHCGALPKTTACPLVPDHKRAGTKFSTQKGEKLADAGAVDGGLVGVAAVPAEELGFQGSTAPVAT